MSITPIRADELDDDFLAPEPARRLLPIRSVDTTPPSFVVPPFLTDDEGMTALFGDGGSGKTSIVAGVAVALTAPGGTLAALARNGPARPAILLPYEARRGLARRIVGLLGTADAPIFLAPDDVMVLPVWAAIPKAAELARVELAEHGGPTAVIVVDSLSFGLSGASVSDPEPAGLTAAAVARAALPVLATAHQNRAGDDSKPFGSAFWHNGARMTWHVKLDQRTVVTTCRKANDHDLLGEVRGYRLSWSEDGLLVGLSAVEIRVTLASRIRDSIIAEGPADPTTLARRGVGAANAIRPELARHPDLFIRDDDGVWGLR